jgi:fluoroquinolone transport system permease protein
VSALLGAGAAQRIAAAARADVRLVVRHGVLAAAAVVTAAWAVLLHLLPPAVRPVGLELVVYGQLAVIGFTFAGAMVLLAKGERTMLALRVTPLRLGELVAARVGVLTVLALASTAVVVVASGAPRAPLWAFITGVTATSVLALLGSLASAAPHATMSRWVLPSVPPLLVLAAPALAYVGVGGRLLWLLPTTGALTLLRGPADAGTAVLALLASAAWGAVLARVAVRRLDAGTAADA